MPFTSPMDSAMLRISDVARAVEEQAKHAKSNSSDCMDLARLVKLTRRNVRDMRKALVSLSGHQRRTVERALAALRAGIDLAKRVVHACHLCSRATALLFAGKLHVESRAAVQKLLEGFQLLLLADLDFSARQMADITDLKRDIATAEFHSIAVADLQADEIRYQFDVGKKSCSDVVEVLQRLLWTANSEVQVVPRQVVQLEVASLKAEPELVSYISTAAEDEHFFGQCLAAFKFLDAEASASKPGGSSDGGTGTLTDPLDDFYDCITRQIMVDPVVLVESGHSYERKAIKQWLKHHDRDPQTNMYLVSKALVPNITLRKSIQQWRERNVAMQGQMAEAWAGATLSKSVKGHVGTVRCLAVTPDSQAAVTGGDDTTVKIWDLPSGALRHTLEGHADWVTCVAVTQDGLMVVSGSSDRTLKLWTLKGGVLSSTLEGHTGHVKCVAMTPDGLTAISCAVDEPTRVWDLKSGTLRHMLEVHHNSIRCLAVTPDSLAALSGSSDNSLELWDLATGTGRHTLKGHTDVVRCVVVSANGLMAVSGSLDRAIRVWDLSSGTIRHTMEGHSDWVISLAITPDGTTALSGSADGTLRIWDLSTGVCRHTLAGYTGFISCVAVAPDGQTAVSGSEDGTLKLWTPVHTKTVGNAKAMDGLSDSS